MLFQGKLHKIEMFADNKSPYSTIKNVWELYQQKYPNHKVAVTNGHWWNMSTLQFVGNYKVNGEILSQAWGASLGFAWDNDRRPIMTWSSMAEDNFIGTVPMMQGGEIRTSDIAVHGTAAARRVWFGFKNDGTCIGKVFEQNERATLEATARTMKELGVIDGIAVDGGGSSSYYDGHTHIASDGRLILSYMIFVFEKETEEKPVSKKRICIDAGHGGNENYNCSPDKRYYEHEGVLDIALKLKALLEPHFDIVMTRETDKTVSLSERATIANNANCDLFVSLHTNAGSSGWSDADGWCIYTYGAGDTLERNKVAKELLDITAANGVDIFGNGIFYNRFAVLAQTNMPAVLIEYAFHTNKRDVELLLDDDYRQKLAALTAVGICNHYGISLEPVPEPTPTPEPTPEAPSEWHEDDWTWAVSEGIFDGTSPKGNITREQTASVVRRNNDYIMKKVTDMLTNAGLL